MWNQSTEDVQVIELNNQIELLPKDDQREQFTINEEVCKNMLSRVKENVNYLHLQTVNNKRNNVPEVDVEYKVTNGSLNNQSKYSIENVEIKKKIKLENEDEIQDSLIKIQNNRFIKQTSIEDDSEDKFSMNSLNRGLESVNRTRSEKNDSQVNYDATSSIDIHPNSKLAYSSNEQFERSLLKKYLEETSALNHIKPKVKVDMSKKFQGHNIYPICSKPRGFCVIINNVDFKVYEQRKGSDLEAKYLKAIFEQLNFEIITYRNMTSLGMLDIFKNIVKRQELAHHDTFVSIILTHGDDSKVLIGTDASRLKVDSFLHYFTNTNCPQLANKPKLFFIQACRGNNHDFGIYDQITVSDAAPVRSSNSKVRKQIKDLNRLNDVLVVNSTLDGFVSLRNEISGSWFGDALGIALCEHSKDMELQKLLLFVNRKILEREKGDVQQAIECNYIGFRKGFYFNPGHFFEKEQFKESSTFS